VAIPAFAFYNFLVARVESLVLDMEKAANEMIYFITHNALTLENTSARVEETVSDELES
jgi:hypothetical protein